MPTTAPAARCSTMASTARPASTGVSTPSSADDRRQGEEGDDRARGAAGRTRATRRHVRRSTRRRAPSSCIALCSADHIWKSAMPARYDLEFP